MVGSLSRIGTNIINVRARRILGVGPSARLPALHGAAGVRAINNVYLQRTADLLDSGLRAADSSILNRLYHWLRESYESADWTPPIDQSSPFLPLLPRGAK